MNRIALPPGIHPGLPMADYLAQPAVSASLLVELETRCPFAAWFGSWMNPGRVDDDSNAAQSAGTIAHSILLEGNSDCVCAIDPNDYPTKTTGNIPDGWTNKAIREARDHARAAGKIPVLVGQLAQIEAMVDSARAFIDSLRETEPAIYAAMQPGGGESEVTLVWDDDGTLCRMRPDRVANDRSLFVDYKTGGTTAEPGEWGRRQMIAMKYHLSAAFYQRGAKAMFGRVPDYVFLVQEQERPFLCSLVGIDPTGYQVAKKTIKRALDRWKQCVRTDTWPAYPNRVAYPEFPPWEVARFEAREGEDLGGIPYDPSKLWSKEAIAR